MGKVQLVIGPPGTGKTTFCLNTVQDYLERGVPPHRIAFLSFTKQAAREAIERATVRFNLPHKRFIYFRTLHSLAWMLNKADWNQAFQDKDWHKFGKMMDIKFGSVLNRKGRRSTLLLDVDECITEGDQLARIEQFSRVMGITLEESYNKYCETDMPWPRLEQFATAFNAYKNHRGLHDYIDLINHCSAPLNVDLAIFDEAQDMTPQQFKMAERITKDVPNVLYAGDDMQAIYEWSGADVEMFLSRSQDRIVLPKSHRLPTAVWDVARGLENRVELDYSRDWTSNDKPGAVHRINNLSSLNLREGEWMLIGRNWKLLEERYVKFLHIMGYPFLIGNVSSLEIPEVLAVLDYEFMRKGNPISMESALRIAKFVGDMEMPDKKQDTYRASELGLEGKGNWMEALDLMTEQMREYIRALLRGGYKLRQKPNIRVDTIHGTKGAECDNVVILTDMLPRSFKTLQKKPDEEVRLFYTGVTRAKKNLYIVDPETPQHFIV